MLRIFPKENNHAATSSSAIKYVYKMSIPNLLMILACIILFDILLTLIANYLLLLQLDHLELETGSEMVTIGEARLCEFWKPELPIDMKMTDTIRPVCLSSESKAQRVEIYITIIHTKIWKK
ncbi:unnamed protein product [Caenorhabditis nigoni]